MYNIVLMEEVSNGLKGILPCFGKGLKTIVPPEFNYILF